MARSKRRRAAPSVSPKPKADVDEGKKAHYNKGDIVEIWSWLKIKAKKGGDATDPNKYAARCMTSGHAPVLEVIDEDTGERHPRFATPLFEGQYTIWRVLI